MAFTVLDRPRAVVDGEDEQRGDLMEHFATGTPMMTRPAVSGWVGRTQPSCRRVSPARRSDCGPISGKRALVMCGANGRSAGGWVTKAGNARRQRRGGEIRPTSQVLKSLVIRALCPPPPPPPPTHTTKRKHTCAPPHATTVQLLRLVPTSQLIYRQFTFMHMRMSMRKV